MLKASITKDATVAAGGAVPFTLLFNTNPNTGLTTAGAALIKKPGFYNVTANIGVTDVAPGEITAQVYADGVAVDNISVTATSASVTDFLTLPLEDVLRVVWTQLQTVATISIVLSTSATVVAGSLLTIEKIK